MIKLLKLLITSSAILSCVLLFCACGDVKTDATNTESISLSSEELAIQSFIDEYDPSTTAVTYNVSDEVLSQTFDGYNFTFLNSDAIYYMYIYLDPEMTGDVLDDTCFERNLIAEEKFDISINEETVPYTNIASHAKTVILADEDVYDVMYIPNSQLTPLISEQLFYDLLEIDELHTENIWWDQPLITRNIIENRLFYATSDLHLMAFEGIWCMYFNEDMVLELGLDLPYQLALDGKWTFDALKQYCASAANLNGDESFAFDPNGKSVYGISTCGTSPYMSYGMGAEITSRDENGKYEFTADTDEHFSDVWQALIGFFGTDNGSAFIGTSADLDADGYYGAFMTNRALFLHAELKGATMLREWENNFGLLPQPKFDELQSEYNSNVFSGCLSFCIPKTNTNLERTGIIVDYLTYHSYAELMPRYYDIHVGLKALGKTDSIAVLSLVRGTRGCEVAVPYGWASELSKDLGALSHEGNQAIASTIEKHREAIIANIEKTYAVYPTLIHAE